MLRFFLRLILLLLAGLLVPGEVAARMHFDARPTAAAEQKLAPGIFDSALAFSRLAAALQAAELQQAKSGRGYESAPGCTHAAERATQLELLWEGEGGRWYGVNGRTGNKVQIGSIKPLSVHGNVIGEQPTFLYEMWEGNRFLKNGIHQDVPGYQRYRLEFLEGKELRYVDHGPRRAIEAIERYKTEHFPGPLNLERHAGTKAGFLPWQWRNLQRFKALPPPQ